MMTTVHSQGRFAPRDIEIVANGIRQHGIEWSQGPGGHLVLMLHGVGCNCWTWEPLGRRLAKRFGERVRLVALDQRGCGDSDRPATGYSPEECAADIFAVADEFGGGPPTLIGHSRGGWLTAYIAGHHPTSLRQAVLVDPARMRWRSAQDVDGFYARVSNGIGPFASWDEAIEAAQKADPEAVWSRARLKTFRFGLREEDGRIVGKLPVEVIEELRSVRLEDVVGPCLKDVVVPTLVLVAKKSDGLRQAEKFAYASGIPHSDVRKFDTTHHMHLDAPDVIARCIGDFIEPNLPA